MKQNNMLFAINFTIILCFLGIMFYLIFCLLHIESLLTKDECKGLTCEQITDMYYSPDVCECGTCGAHVLEWWYVRNDANTEWVAVCSKCYDAIAE